MSDVLAKLFGSPYRVKIIRLFLLNSGEVLTAKEISKRAKIAPDKARREISLLSGIKFISKKSRPRRVSGKKIEGWSLNSSFGLLQPMKKFVLNAAPLSRRELLQKVQKIGRIKLVVLAGIFLQEDASRVDILIVGDGIKKGVLEMVLRRIEAEVGKELSYAVFTTQDFFYRLNIYDKFVRDILDYPHEKILNKLGL